ncbi:hypothetical protein D3C85_432370 [compost metagenome]
MPLHVDDEEAAHGRGFAVVDDGEYGFALVAHILIALQGLAEHLLVQLARQTQLAIEILIPAGVALAAEAERHQQRQPQPEASQPRNPMLSLHP